MRLEYDIKTTPEETSGYNLTAYTEGVLRLLVGSSVFLEVDGILLVEFAIVLHKWLLQCASAPTDFYYASMDFEEEPILMFRYDSGRDAFLLESVWSNKDVGSVLRSDAIEAASRYLVALRDELKRERGVDLERTLEEATLDG